MKRSQKKLNYKQIIRQHIRILKNLQHESGLFSASKKNIQTGYDKSWLRDNFYTCLAFEVIGDWETVNKTYNALLKVFIKHEKKIDAAIKSKPKHKHEYIHARVHPKTFNEFWEEWGNKQNDSIGSILYTIGRLEENNKNIILDNKDKIRITNKLVKYLGSVEYWKDEDNGIWEEDEEIHASSVGACLSGLKMIRKIKEIEVPDILIKKGEESLNKLLPRESKKKFVDLALLSLIFPYNIVNARQRKQILKNVEYHLLRNRGVIRYKNDYYYNKNPDGYSEEAEWTFGLSWLAIIYEKLKDRKKAKQLIEKMKSLSTKEGIPELYFSNSKKHNENNPLAWSESLFIIALHNINKKHTKSFRDFFFKKTYEYQ